MEGEDGDKWSGRLSSRSLSNESEIELNERERSQRQRLTEARRRKLQAARQNGMQKYIICLFAFYIEIYI